MLITFQIKFKYIPLGDLTVLQGFKYTYIYLLLKSLKLQMRTILSNAVVRASLEDLGQFLE